MPVAVEKIKLCPNYGICDSVFLYFYVSKKLWEVNLFLSTIMKNELKVKTLAPNWAANCLWVVDASPWGWAVTGGKGVRNSGSLLLILLRIVRAPYSCLSDATFTGTMLCASTCVNVFKRQFIVSNYVSWLNVVSFNLSLKLVSFNFNLSLEL